MGSDRRALTAAFSYLVMGTVGGTFLLIGIGLVYQMTGTLNMADLGDRLTPVLGTRTVWMAFAFLYWFFPNTRVSKRSAALGALVAMLLFTLTRVVYVDLSVGAARYSFLFGGLVALPLVLTWIYVIWAVILFGAEVAFAHQNIAHYREDLRRPVLAPSEREELGVR